MSQSAQSAGASERDSFLQQQPTGSAGTAPSNSQGAGVPAWRPAPSVLPCAPPSGWCLDALPLPLSWPGADDVARLGYQQWLARHLASAPNPSVLQAYLQQAAVAGTALPGMPMPSQQQQHAAAASSRNSGGSGSQQLPPPQPQGAMQVRAQHRKHITAL